jgi:hypothetical protein
VGTDFCLNSISAILKYKEFEWAGGPPGIKTVHKKKSKSCSAKHAFPEMALQNSSSIFFAALAQS